MKYLEELNKSMDWLGQQEKVLFLGQSCLYPGTALFNTLKEVPKEKIIETPVFEDSQIGMSIGLSLGGFIPLNLMPRFNFTLLACNQIVNHLDKYIDMSDRQYIPKVIIRTVIGSENPLFPGHQHIGDFSQSIQLMCKNIEVIRLDGPEQIFLSYQKAYERTDDKSTILVEWGDRYSSK